MSRNTSTKLHEYRELINPDNNAPIFSNISKLTNSITKSTGNDKFTLHDLRRISVIFRLGLIDIINKEQD